MKYLNKKNLPFPTGMTAYDGSPLEDGDIIVEVPNGIELSTVRYWHFDENLNFLLEEYVNTKIKNFREFRAYSFFYFDRLKNNVLLDLAPSLSEEEKGQTLIEYALIVLLISIVVIVILGALGGDINAVFTTIQNTFSGASST